MTSTLSLYDAVVARIADQAPTVTVYQGSVPDNPPADSSGRVYPYVVLWDAPGTYPAFEVESLGATTADLEAVSWTCRATVAAGQLGWLRDAAQLVRSALAGYRPTRLSGRLSDEGTEPITTKDPDVTPVRYYVPLIFTMLAP